jgi:hypothetical protein
VGLSDWELRPADDSYYAERTTYLRQGDLFQDVPLGYPWPAMIHLKYKLAALYSGSLFSHEDFEDTVG